MFLINPIELEPEFNLPEDVSNLIIQCLNDDPEYRPNFSNIVESLEKIYQDNEVFKSDKFDEYKKYLKEPEKIEIIRIIQLLKHSMLEVKVYLEL